MSEPSSARSSAADFLTIDVGSHVSAVRRGVLFRSAWGLDPGLRAAVATGVVCIDLRTAQERTAVRMLAGDRIRHIPIEQGRVSETIGAHPGRAEYATMYRRILDRCRPALCEAIEEIARSVRPGVVVGCSVGKDRTAVVLALILSAIGTSVEEIVRAERDARADLIGYIGGVPDQAIHCGTLRREQLLDRLRIAPEALEDGLAHCESSNGSTSAYLTAIGVSGRTLSHLADLLD